MIFERNDLSIVVNVQERQRARNFVVCCQNSMGSARVVVGAGANDLVCSSLLSVPCYCCSCLQTRNPMIDEMKAAAAGMSMKWNYDLEGW